MYKFLLCLKYLRTRFLAFVCIVSVMLGVATLVVVNSVMAGFSTKLKDRFHGLLSDVIVESPSYNGFPEDADEMMAKIRNSPANEHIEAMTPTIEVFGMVIYEVGPSREKVTIPVHVVGTDAKGRAAIGGFGEYLQQPDRRQNPSFESDSRGDATLAAPVRSTPSRRSPSDPIARRAAGHRTAASGTANSRRRDPWFWHHALSDR